MKPNREIREINQTFNSDISVCCNNCNTVFSGKALCWEELLKMMNGHPCWKMQVVADPRDELATNLPEEKK